MKYLVHIGLLFLFCKTIYAQEEKVNVTVYYESLCPFAKKFIVTQLYPALQGNLSEYVNLELIPYGKSVTKEIGGNLTFTCHHGNVECYGNLIQVCSRILIDVGKNSSNLGFNQKYLWLVKCFMENISTSSTKKDLQDSFLHCSNDSVLIGTQQTILVNCTDGSFGMSLLEHYGNLTDQFQKPLNNVPTIVYNNKFDKADSGESEKNFIRVLCRKITWTKPNECRIVNAAETNLLTTKYPVILLLSLILFVIKI
ncbi:GILT-like protein 1 [Diorhabda carinulata]|uniref:GILT-like protein 1 n=1 Tax=Diorhabda carinulata TaxID=1163345 RepID=UPI0025A226E7|nr:GILT-like protein 1 [Diorhabda carinulata]